MATDGLKIMIAAGGTGGHIFPGVAVAEALRREKPNATIVFAGTKRGLEERVLPKLGYNIVFVKSMKFKGAGWIKKFFALAVMPLSVLSAVGLIMKIKPRLLVSVGGYASAPVAFACWLFGIPIVLVEPNAIPGMANRWVSKFAKKIFIAFDEARNYFDSGKTVRSGTPVRDEVISLASRESTSQDKVGIFVFGGSQGARTLNQAMIDAIVELKEVKDKIRVFHQTGSEEVARSISTLYKGAGIEASVFDFTDGIWNEYAKSDFVIARSGAGTVAELAALCIPSLLIPYPYAADDHQKANANGLVNSGGAMMIEDKNCNGRLLARIIKDFALEPNKLLEMRAKLKKLNANNASNVVAKESLKFVKGN